MSKQGIPAFLLDCSPNDKVELIEAEFGLKGFAIVVKLWQKIYGSNGYYCEWTNEIALMFAKRNNVDVNVVSDIVAASIRRGIFDKTLFDKYGILTSEGIQKRYFEVVSRRKCVEVEKQYLLIDCDQKYKNVNILDKNVNISSENADNLTASKDKVSKGKVTKDKVNTTTNCDIAKKAEKSYYDWSQFTEEEMNEPYPEYLSNSAIKLTIAEVYMIAKHLNNTKCFDDYIFKMQFYPDIKDQFSTIIKWAIQDGNYKE